MVPASVGELVDRDALAALRADEHRLVAALDIEPRGHLDHELVHADAPDLLAPLTADEHRHLVREHPVHAVGVAERQRRDRGRAPPRAT